MAASINTWQAKYPTLVDVRVVRVPDTESSLRLIGALYVETHQTWFEDNGYLNVSLLTKHQKVLKTAA